MRFKKPLIAVASCMLACGLAACAPGATEQLNDTQAESVENAASTQAEATGKNAEFEKENDVITRPDGTKVMLAPYYSPEKGMPGIHYSEDDYENGTTAGNDFERNDELCVAGTGFSEIMYNTDILHANQRGCESCHSSLLETLNKLDPEHSGISNGNSWLEVKSLGVEVCVACHTTDAVFAQSEPDFSELMHGIHNVGVGEDKATCMQCHEADVHAFDKAAEAGVQNMLGQTFVGSPAEWKLWDEVKYDVMKGIYLVNDIEGDFSFTQDTVTPSDHLFNETWLANTSQEIAEKAGFDGAQFANDLGSIDSNPELKEEILQNWEFSVTGFVNEEKTFKWGDVMANAPVQTVLMKEHCGITKLGGWQIGQVEVTGVPVDWFIEQCGGYTKDAKFIDATSLDSSENDALNMGLFIGSTPIDWTKDYDVMMVYQINGEYLSWVQGFPLQLWVGAAAADAYMKQCTGLVITNDETRLGTNTTEEKMCMGPIQYPGYGGVKANCAITNTYEGQIVQAGEPYTFSGYLDGWYEQVGGIMVSADNGQTWTKFETPDTNPQQWVTWDFTWNVPEGNRAYVIDIKPFLADGSETLDSVRVMVNAVDKEVYDLGEFKQA